jgi:hypothetical protein
MNVVILTIPWPTYLNCTHMSAVWVIQEQILSEMFKMAKQSILDDL